MIFSECNIINRHSRDGDDGGGDDGDDAANWDGAGYHSGHLCRTSHIGNGSKALCFSWSECFPVCASKQTQHVFECTP
jgi:hypothetical protein